MILNICRIFLKGCKWAYLQNRSRIIDLQDKRVVSWGCACVHAKSLQSYSTLCNPKDCSPLSSSIHGNSPGKITGVGCHALLQGIFLTQGSNPHLLRLLHWQAGFVCLFVFTTSCYLGSLGVRVGRDNFGDGNWHTHSTKTVTDFIFGGPQNHCRWWLQPWNWKMLVPWKKSYDQIRQHLKNQRHYFANKGPSSQTYGFSSSHVWMWELDHKESWAPKNWCFWTVVLDKTLESSLDCKEI